MGRRKYILSVSFFKLGGSSDRSFCNMLLFKLLIAGIVKHFYFVQLSFILHA